METWAADIPSRSLIPANVRALADGLDFGTADFVSNDGKRLPITARWRRIGDNGYEAIDNDVDAGKGAPRRYTKVD